MNLNMETTRSSAPTGKGRVDQSRKGREREGELIANAIIKNSDSLQRCNNCNYESAALSSPAFVFEVRGRTFTVARDFASSPFIANRFI